MRSLINIVVVSTFLGCSSHVTTVAPIKQKKVEVVLPAIVTPKVAEVEKKSSQRSDLDIYSQTIEPYLKNITETSIKADAKKFFKEYYKVWSYTKAPESLQAIMWPFSSYTKKETYGLNLQKLTNEYFDNLKVNANYKAYSTLNSYALTRKQVDLRSFTTDNPLFYDPKIAGEGFPFDYVQNSSIHTNEPLYLSHYSKDRRWVFVFSSYASGWLHVEDIKEVSTKEIKSIIQAKHVFIRRDNVNMYSKEGKFISYANIGAILPLVEEDSNGMTLLVAGYSNRLEKVKISKQVGSKEVLAINTLNVNTIASDILKSKYGWGGLFHERDCSSTLKDFFTPFGVYLPRNSFQQSNIGEVISLDKLSDKQKLEIIKEKGKPFKTLLYRKGHIVLYIGEFKGTPMILQNIWGIKTIDDTGVEGRVLVSKAVISTLEIGKELENVDKENLLLHTLIRMNTIAK